MEECQRKGYTGKSPTSNGSTLGEVTTEGVHREEYQQRGYMGRSIIRGSTRGEELAERFMRKRITSGEYKGKKYEQRKNMGRSTSRESTVHEEEYVLQLLQLFFEFHIIMSSIRVTYF